MRRLVADLLLLARADTGREAPRKQVDVGSVVRDAAAEEAPVASQHDLAVDAPGGLLVEGSPDDLHRLALNLIDNALAHTPPGTAVRVTALREDDSIVLEVADEGPGVPAGVRVFDRFVRAPGAGSGGSGLGLSIVDAVARTHGGSVELADADGGGTRVTMTVSLESDGAGRIVRRIQRSAAQRMVQETVDAELDKIPAHVEQAATA
jgi:signal transduction histidine kinase